MGAATASKKEQWVAALRSGDYKQFTGGRLRDKFECPTSYCCLGVAGELIEQATSAFYHDIRKAFGMTLKVENILIEMNDSGAKSFAEIADWVETHDLQTGELLPEATAPGRAPPTPPTRSI